MLTLRKPGVVPVISDDVDVVIATMPDDAPRATRTPPKGGEGNRAGRRLRANAVSARNVAHMLSR